MRWCMLIKSTLRSAIFWVLWKKLLHNVSSYTGLLNILGSHTYDLRGNNSMGSGNFGDRGCPLLRGNKCTITMGSGNFGDRGCPLLRGNKCTITMGSGNFGDRGCPLLRGNKRTITMGSGNFGDRGCPLLRGNKCTITMGSGILGMCYPVLFSEGPLSKFYCMMTPQHTYVGTDLLQEMLGLL